MTSVVSFPSAGIGINMDVFGSKEEENSSGMRGKGSEADNCCDAWVDISRRSNDQKSKKLTS